VPQKPQIFGHEQPIDEEKMARLTCRSSGSKPAAQLRWKKGNKELKAEGTEVLEDSNGKTFTVSSRVEFRVTKEDNDAEVTCTVDHESLQNSERSTTQKLQVHCTWRVGMAGDGDRGMGHPGKGPGPEREVPDPLPPRSPQEFLWEKEGSDAPLQLSSDSILIFPFLNKSDSGTYICTATSSMGSVVAKYNLDVSGKGGGQLGTVAPCQRLRPVETWVGVEGLGGVGWGHAHSPWEHPQPRAGRAASLPVPCRAAGWDGEQVGGTERFEGCVLSAGTLFCAHSQPLGHRCTYLTHEAKGSDDAPDADTAIINAEGGQAGGDDKKEYFI
ncbi:CADM3 protein, partial [Penelope pileata]|nr:CADM3 protein [Penelope pileata]